MSTFLYKGYSAEGFKVSGSKDLDSEKQVASLLEIENISSTQIFPSKTKFTTRNYASVSPQELSMFCRHMTILFYSNITIMEGVAVLAEQSENKQLTITLMEIKEFMEKGFTFGEAISMYPHIFTAYLVNMINIGEASGSLDTVFSKMSTYYEKEALIRKKLKSAIVYPAVLTTLMASIVVLLILKILPMFNEILTNMGGELPAVTMAVLDFSQFVNKYLLIIIFATALLIFLAIFLLRTTKGAAWLDKMKFKLPWFRYINTRIITSRFSRSLSILLKSGVQLLTALDEIIPTLDNAYLEVKFREAALLVKGGADLSEALKVVGIFPTLFLKTLVIGQATGHLDDMLDKSANLLDDDVHYSIEKITMMIEPILIIILSVIVGMVLLSVMLPMISIMNQIG